MEFPLLPLKNEPTEIHLSSRLLDTVKCPAHMHHCIEIVFVVDGVMHMTISGREFAIPSGHAVFVKPYESHSFSDDMQNKSYIIEFMMESNLDFWDFIQSHTIEDPCIMIPPETIAYLVTKLPTNSDRNSGERLNPTFVQAILAPLCYEFMSHCKTTAHDDKYDKTSIMALKLVSGMIWQNPQQDVSLSAVAKQMGIHKTTLSKNFSHQTQMSFTEYVQYIRVCKAAFLMRQNLSISAASDFAGFNSIRSFNRVFKKVTGCTPSEYIRLNDQQSDRCNMVLSFE